MDLTRVFGGGRSCRRRLRRRRGGCHAASRVLPVQGQYAENSLYYVNTTSIPFMTMILVSKGLVQELCYLLVPPHWRRMLVRS